MRREEILAGTLRGSALYDDAGKMLQAYSDMQGDLKQAAAENALSAIAPNGAEALQLAADKFAATRGRGNALKYLGLGLLLPGFALLIEYGRMQSDEMHVQVFFSGKMQAHPLASLVLGVDEQGHSFSRNTFFTSKAFRMLLAAAYIIFAVFVLEADIDWP